MKTTDKNIPPTSKFTISGHLRDPDLVSNAGGYDYKEPKICISILGKYVKEGRWDVLASGIKHFMQEVQTKKLKLKDLVITCRET